MDSNYLQTENQHKKNKIKSKWSNFDSIEPNIGNGSITYTKFNKRSQWRIKTINSSTFSATKWILDLKKETTSSKQGNKKKKNKKKNKSKLGYERRLREGCKRLCLERKGTNWKRPMQALSLPLSFSKITLYAYAFE